jgi:hypothetical protein
MKQMGYDLAEVEEQFKNSGIRLWAKVDNVGLSICKFKPIEVEPKGRFAALGYLIDKLDNKQLSQLKQELSFDGLELVALKYDFVEVLPYQERCCRYFHKHHPIESLLNDKSDIEQIDMPVGGCSELPGYYTLISPYGVAPRVKQSDLYIHVDVLGDEQKGLFSSQKSIEERELATSLSKALTGPDLVIKSFLQYAAPIFNSDQKLTSKRTQAYLSLRRYLSKLMDEKPGLMVGSLSELCSFFLSLNLYIPNFATPIKTGRQAHESTLYKDYINKKTLPGNESLFSGKSGQRGDASYWKRVESIFFPNLKN